MSGATEALKYQQQIDEDGVMVRVSRQAVDEVLKDLAAKDSQIKALQDKLDGVTITMREGPAARIKDLEAELEKERKITEAWHQGHWKADVEAVKSYKDIAAKVLEKTGELEAKLAEAGARIRELEAMTKGKP